jgi:cell division transport system permease protein
MTSISWINSTALAASFSPMDGSMFSNDAPKLRFRARTPFRARPASEEAATAGAPRRRAPLVPTDSIAGRSLVIVIAIMTFLAALAAGAALLVADASVDWTKEIAREASVQLRPTPGRDVEADAAKAAEILRATPGVRDVRVYSRQESEALVAPWLGQDLDLRELPTPRMIVVKLDPDQRADLDELRQELQKALPNAALDDHRLWVRRLGAMARTAVAVAVLIFVLIVSAMALAVAVATRAAMAGNREIIEVLHIVGASDSFIAREFQRRFLVLGLRGGFFGGAAAILFFLGAGALSGSWTATPGGDQIEALFGAFSLGPTGTAIVLILSAAIAILPGYMSQAIVFRHLRQLDRNLLDRA